MLKLSYKRDTAVGIHCYATEAQDLYLFTYNVK